MSELPTCFIQTVQLILGHYQRAVSVSAIRHTQPHLESRSLRAHLSWISLWKLNPLAPSLHPEQDPRPALLTWRLMFLRAAVKRAGLDYKGVDILGASPIGGI